jgi:hypothetical protein
LIKNPALIVVSRAGLAYKWGRPANRQDIQLRTVAARHVQREIEGGAGRVRGPRNGGTETCTILTVLDNLGRFRERHPFHYCRSLYTRR